MLIEKKLEELNIKLPSLPKPIASYVPYKKTGKLIFISGQGPIIDGKVIFQGKVGLDINEEQAYEAARLTGLNLLAILKLAVKDLDTVVQIVTIHGYVNSIDEYKNQPNIINGISDLMIKVFEDKGYHARYAISCNGLPMNIPVEAEMVVEVK